MRLIVLLMLLGWSYWWRWWKIVVDIWRRWRLYGVMKDMKVVLWWRKMKVIMFFLLWWWKKLFCIFEINQEWIKRYDLCFLFLLLCPVFPPIYYSFYIVKIRVLQCASNSVFCVCNGWRSCRNCVRLSGRKCVYVYVLKMNFK